MAADGFVAVSVFRKIEILELFTRRMFQAQNRIVRPNDDDPSPFEAISSATDVDPNSLGALYPILNDFAGSELSTLTRNKSLAIPVQNVSVQVTNGVRKVVIILRAYNRFVSKHLRKIF